MENRSHAIMAAIFLIVFAAGAVLLFFWLKGTKPISKTYAIVTGESVNGLSTQTEVKFKGITVGRVQKIAFAPHDPTKVRILIGVDKQAYITHATYAELPLKGITGGHYVELKLTKKGDQTPLQTNNDHPARIPLKPTLIGRIGNAGQQDIKKINAIIASLQKILGKQNRRHLAGTVAELNTAAHKLVAMENAMLPALKNLPKLVESSQHLLESSRELIATAKTPVKKATAVESSFKDLSESGQQVTGMLVHNTLPQINTLAERLESTARHLDRLSRELAAKPQSLIFGGPNRPPGPGEPGFNSGNNSGKGKQ
jgi:phospholipid/cholesterol/gamma-HCH transport system substrate-binding protein